MHDHEPRLIEPVPIDDDLCTGLALIEDLGFGARFVLIAEQTVYEAGEPALVIKRKIVLPDAAIVSGLTLALQWVAARTGRFARDTFLRLVR